MRTLVLVILTAVPAILPAHVSAQTPPTAMVTTAPATPAAAEQGRRAPGASRRPSQLSNHLEIRGFGVVGTTWFTASNTFDAVLGSGRGQDFGGGLSLTQGPGYIEIGARHFSKDGERVFVGTDRQVFPLGIATTVTMTPLDVTVGWRFRPRFGRVIPHVGAGYTRMKYEETSDFADASENVSASFNGYHVVGGAEVRVARWVGLTGEVMWTSVPDGLGEGGASKAFDEKDLGGTSLRLKLVLGR